MSVTDLNELAADVLWNSTTGGVVDWQSVRDALNAVEPLTSRERCELLLKCANGDALTAAEWSSLVGAPLSPNVVGPLTLGLSPLGVRAPKDARKALIAVLEQIGGEWDPPGAPHKNAAEIVNGNVLVMPELSVKKVRGRTERVRRSRVLARSPGEALIYALNLMLDPTREFAAELRRCTLTACGRFALERAPSGPGQPPNYFCCDEHRVEYKREQTRKRVAQHRKAQRNFGRMD
jgi:hypothetical protein